ncbi:NADP-dependent oxidoreductase [Streptomyces sp. NPDC091377]|uniref:NADP-dependent oxidoreductase n=1 Tax=Streptomyces sp. NPDC091377 TaxID=3365995 RepID=UPI003806FDF8
MRAALVEELAGVDAVAVGELAAPLPGDGQALVRVHAAGVGPWDVGFLGGGFPGVQVPFVPGQEIAGVVEAAGERAGVRPGDWVWGTLFPAGGGFAELAVLDGARMAAMPRDAGFEEAAGLVIGAGTAYEGVIERGRLQGGETLLVTAAAGGVGSAAVQIGVAAGARVIGVASGHHHAFVRGLGAEAVIDYHDPGWAREVLRLVPGGVDLLMDCAGGASRDEALRAVRDGGRAEFIVLSDAEPALERGITGDSFAAQVDRARLEALGGLVDTGRLRMNVDAALPLEDAKEALTRVAAGHTRGKVVLRVA